MKAEDILEKYTAGIREFSALNLSGINFSGVNLSGANLRKTAFNQSNLNRAKLTGANLSGATFNQANLSVANLALADLSNTELTGADLANAALTRADLNGANLRAANLSQADLKEAKLCGANLRGANLSRADLRQAKLTSANLAQANLASSDLSNTDLSGADLRQTELRQVNLSRANLQGANLSGANLRWADLSGANLSGADLTGAKLSGANLTGANLSHATLLDATLVHVDFTRANLSSVDWTGADLSGCTLTGAKLHAVSPFGVKTAGAVCRWVDLSPQGDQSQIHQFLTDDPQEYFNEAPPAVQLLIDDRLHADAHCALAVTYHQLSKKFRSAPPPNIEIHRRRTILTFKLDRDDQLFLIAYLAIFPFADAELTQQNIRDLIQLVPTQTLSSSPGKVQQFQHLVTNLSQYIQEINAFKQLQSIPIAINKLRYFQSPTRTLLTNSKNQTLTVYDNPYFGKRSLDHRKTEEFSFLSHLPAFQLPDEEEVISFVKGFHN